MTTDPEEPTARGPGLALIGTRGTGKTTVGRLLADRLGWPFHDADREVEARAGRSIAALFAEDGEAAFRDREAEVLEDLTRRGAAVLATGGGAILRDANRRALRRFGFVVWLAARPEVVARRLEADPATLAARPALTPLGTLAEIATVLHARAPLYRAACDAVVATDDQAPEQVADAVLAAWKGWDGSR